MSPLQRQKQLASSAGDAIAVFSLCRGSAYWQITGGIAFAQLPARSLHLSRVFYCVSVDLLNLV